MHSFNGKRPCCLELYKFLLTNIQTKKLCETEQFNSYVKPSGMSSCFKTSKDARMYTCKNVHGSHIHNNPRAETMQKFSNCKVAK